MVFYASSCSRYRDLHNIYSICNCILNGNYNNHKLYILYFQGTLNPSILICFVNQPKTFDEAQQYCRDNYIDLVTLSDRAEVEKLFALENFTYTGYAWIGLKKTRRDQWRWALADQEFYKEGETEYRNWGPGEPTNYGDEYCAVMDDKGKFRDTQCEPYRTFVCFSGNYWS